MKNIDTKLAAVALTAAARPRRHSQARAAAPAQIDAAVNSGSPDAIIAEVERAEGLICEECIQTVTNLTEDNRFAVREVAGLVVREAPGLAKAHGDQMKDDLASGDSFARAQRGRLPRLRPRRTPRCRRCASRSSARDLDGEAKLAIVRAVGYMAHLDGNGILVTRDGATADATVRAAAVTAWRDILGQIDASRRSSPMLDRRGREGPRGGRDRRRRVRRRRSAARTLEELVVSDTDPFVRRNAAWALGQLGSRDASRRRCSRRLTRRASCGCARAALAAK